MVHIPTAFTMFGLTQLACVMVMGLIWYKNKQINGLLEWSIGRSLLVMAFLLFAFRESMPLMLSVLLSNGIFLIALYVIWLGHVRFMQLSYTNTHLIFIALLLVTLVVFAALTQVEQGYLLRVIIISILVSLYAALSIIVYLPAIREKDKPLVNLMVFSYSLLIIIHMLRALFYLAGFGGQSLLTAGSVTAITIVGYFFVSFLIVMVSLGMVVELLQKELKQAADRDALTGAYNRRAFFTIVENVFARAKRERLPISVLSIDLDHFKLINDTYGHLRGDKVIRSFVNTSLELLRTPDLFARYGGEEFVVVLPDTNIKDAAKIAERIRQRFSELSPAQSIKAGEVTCSIGIASVDALADNISIIDLLERSDIALYHAKSHGRNTVSTY
ncbi:hypothetical protein MACH09_18480 [Vibrio sp. MACH09]|uniref:GGDEF domain-containing protein n=1 Tax=Vibrio sp. MACH09 TaxID=3025122 RepID=UPI0027916727|nr:GGDEF domain-containing protein [Vibrio sp. MACH09]GLO61340.1 hypothetical protein MACH09_18480 [Vibrio sp. MACH09]